MKIDDPIYNFMYKYKLPISRGDSTVKDFLNNYFNNYTEELETALKSTSKRELRNECYTLINEHLVIIKELCGIVKKSAVIKYPKSEIGRYQAA